MSCAQNVTSPRSPAGTRPQEKSFAWVVVVLMGVGCLAVGAVAQQPAAGDKKPVAGSPPAAAADGKQTGSEKQAGSEKQNGEPSGDSPSSSLDDLAMTQARIADKYGRL